MKKEELYELTDSLKIPANEYCVLSGGSLVLHNIRETTDDLDIDITQKGFELIKNNFTPVLKDKDKNLYEITDKIECFLDNNFETDIEIIDGYPSQSLLSVYKLKKRLNREKDQSDIKAIEKALNIK